MLRKIINLDLILNNNFLDDKMLNNSKKAIALKMLDEFEKQLNDLYNAFTEQKISFNECSTLISWLINAWKLSRLNIKNIGTEENTVDFIEYEKNVYISFPDWFKNDTGKGSQIHTNNNTSLLFNCINDGNLEITLRGVHYEDYDGKALPIYINYTNCKINDMDVLSEEKLVWCFEPFIHSQKCSDEEKIRLNLEFETIFDFFPYLETPFLNVKNENNLHYAIQYMNKQIYNERLIINTKDLQIKIALINKKNEELSQKLEMYKKENDEILNSYNTLFNNLFIFQEIEPKELVRLSRELNIELLNFIDNVCKKYDLKWWLYAGSLLGAIRHGGFIPWDDDIDISMLREDYEKFYQIIDTEIKEFKLTDFIKVNNNTINNDNVYLPFVKVNYYVDNDLFGFIDIFPTDYVTKLISDMEALFHEERQKIRYELKKGSDRTKTLNVSFKKLQVSDKKTNLLMSGIEGPIFSINNYSTIFPLTTIKFENQTYPCPRNYKKYVVSLYGDNYMKIPKTIYHHGFYELLLSHNDVYQKFNEGISKLRKVNSNFNSKYLSFHKLFSRKKNNEPKIHYFN